jgi:hypothetical protein
MTSQDLAFGSVRSAFIHTGAKRREKRSPGRKFLDGATTTDHAVPAFIALEIVLMA